MKKDLICIVCPRGCSVTVEGEIGALVVTGCSCKKGEQYAVEECTHPTRTVTSIVRVSNREDTMASVKTSCPIPKESIFAAMEAIRGLSVEAPVCVGAVVCKDLYGAEVIVTKEVL
jgi:CxxC motif-containing protein